MTDPIDDEKWSYKPEQLYEITLAPNDEYQGLTVKGKNLTLIQRDYKGCRKVINNILSIAQGISMVLVPEYSMPQYGQWPLIPRLHYHGVLQLRDWEAVRYFLENTLVLLSKIGRYQINIYRPLWVDYMYKNHKMFAHDDSYELYNDYQLKEQISDKRKLKAKKNGA